MLSDILSKIFALLFINKYGHCLLKFTFSLLRFFIYIYLECHPVFWFQIYLNKVIKYSHFFLSVVRFPSHFACCILSFPALTFIWLAEGGVHLFSKEVAHGFIYFSCFSVFLNCYIMVSSLLNPLLCSFIGNGRERRPTLTHKELNHFLELFELSTHFTDFFFIIVSCVVLLLLSFYF